MKCIFQNHKYICTCIHHIINMHHQSLALLEKSIPADVGSKMATPFIINISPCQIHARQSGFHNLNCQILRIGLGRSYHPWLDMTWIASYSEMGREKYIC